MTETDFEEPFVDLAESKLSRDRKGEELLKKVAEKVKRGDRMDEEGLIKEIDWDTRFYVLGLEAPNRGRASIRFFYSDPFIKIVQRIGAHYSDLRLGEAEKPISLRRILNETVSKKAREQKIAPLLTGAVFSSILTGSPYPAALYNAIMIRIRADMDDEEERIYKINYTRAAVIKAYLIRKYRHQSHHPFQEVLQMSLNKQSTIPAYVLGRLFAVLESAQIEAAKPAKLDSTIKDHYFTSACASPKSVFPTLLRLSQHHTSKSDKYNNDRRIQDILGLLDVEKNPIPARLTLDEQGIFVLGYYHQRAAFYVSQTDNNVVETTPTESE